MLEDNELACRHMNLTKGQIIEVIRKNNITSFEELQDETNVAMICGSCTADIEEILEEEINKRESK